MVVTMHIITQGIIAGLIMGVFAMAMNMMKYTTLNLTEYMGCMLTGKKTGNSSVAAGFGAHLLASAMFAVIYINIIVSFNLPMNLQTTMFIAASHTMFAGIMLNVMDKFNQCVAAKKVKAMGMFGINHGNAGIMVYILAHILYTVIVMHLLGASLI